MCPFGHALRFVADRRPPLQSFRPEAPSWLRAEQQLWPAGSCHRTSCTPAPASSERAWPASFSASLPDPVSELPSCHLAVGENSLPEPRWVVSLSLE
eukprot:220731-Rhodomonas_salina.1